MTNRELVVCGDDLGLHPAINAGVFRCFEAGTLTAASLVVAGEATDEALRFARDHAQLDVGVHLALLDVRPLGDPAPWRDVLDHRGRFPPSAHASGVARLAWWATRHPDVALAEFDAQLQRAADLGLTVTHVNGHNHLHLLPALTRGVAALCHRWGVPWVRVPRAPVRRLVSRRWRSDRGGVKGTVVRTAGRAAGRHLRSGTLRSADHLVGLGWVGPAVTVSRAAQLAARLGPGITEWMVHPATASRDLATVLPWGRGWGRELEALCAPEFLDALEAQGIQRVGFSRARSQPPRDGAGRTRRRA